MFSGYVWLKPCANATSHVAAKVLCEWASVFIVPKVIYSDQGPHFKNELVEEVRKAFKCNHHFTTPYAHWANGGVERANRSVLRLFRALLSENVGMGKTGWPYLVPAVQAALNQTPSPRNDGVPPVTGMLALEPAHPLDTVVPTPIVGTKVSAAAREVTKMTMSERVKQMLNDVRVAIEEMHVQIAESSAAKRAANRRAAIKRGVRPHAGFTVGDFVLVAVEEPDKLQLRWAGPRG